MATKKELKRYREWYKNSDYYREDRSFDEFFKEYPGWFNKHGKKMVDKYEATVKHEGRLAQQQEDHDAAVASDKDLQEGQNAKQLEYEKHLQDNTLTDNKNAIRSLKREENQADRYRKSCLLYTSPSPRDS